EGLGFVRAGILIFVYITRGRGEGSLDGCRGPGEWAGTPARPSDSSTGREARATAPVPRLPVDHEEGGLAHVGVEDGGDLGLDADLVHRGLHDGDPVVGRVG